MAKAFRKNLYCHKSLCVIMQGREFQNVPVSIHLYSALLARKCSPRIILEWFTNHQESFKNHFRMVHESLRIAQESFQNGLLITENQQELLKNHFRMAHKSPRINSTDCPHFNSNLWSWQGVIQVL